MTYAHQQKKEKEQVPGSLNKGTSLERGTYKRRGRKPKKQIQQSPEGPSMQSESQSSEVQSQKVEIPVKLAQRTRSRRGIRQVSYAVEVSKSESSDSQIQQQPEKDSNEADQKVPENKSRSSYPLRTNRKTRLITRAVGKKRGRPKKKIVQSVKDDSESQKHEISEQEADQQPIKQQQPEHPKSTSKKRQPQEQISCQQQLPIKPREKPLRVRPTGENRGNTTRVERLPRVKSNRDIDIENKSQAQNDKFNLTCFLDRQEKTNEQLHPNRELIIERIKFCLGNRDELIEYLDELNVTTNIVKEILDLDVTTVILDGQVTTEMIRVMDKLKAAVLHRYFPDDIKMKKRYQKITKKAMSKPSAAETAEESREDLELRRKTIAKLQKIMKGIQIKDSADLKEKAIQIETHFRKYDETIGGSYKAMAYKVLRSIKDKTDSIQDVITKLERGEFQE